MKRNVGGIDRAIRMVLGLSLVLGSYFGSLPTWGAIAVFIIGAMTLATGVIQFCILWAALGVNTCRQQFPKKA